MYLTFQINAYLEASRLAEDTSKSLFDQKIENKDAKTWIADRVLEMSKEYVAIEKKFEELKLTLTEEDENILENQLESNWSYAEAYYQPNGAGKKSYEKILTNSYKNNMIFKKYYDKGGLEEVSEADLKKEMVDSIAKLKYIQMPMKDAEGNKLKSEGKEKLKKTAEKYVERLKNKENIDDLIKEYEDILAKQEEEAKKDSDSSSTSSNTSSTSSNTSSAASSSASSATSSTSSSGSSSDSTSSSTEEEEEDPNEVLIFKADTTKSEKFLNSVFETKYDTPTILEDDENYYVAIRYDISKDEKRFEEYRESLLYEMKKDEFEEMLSGWCKDYKVETNSDSAKRYKVEKLDFPQATGY